MSIQNLIKQTEELVFNIGQQAPYKDLHGSALALLKGMYNWEQQQTSRASNEPKNNDNYEATDDEVAQIRKAERKLLKWATDRDTMPAKIIDVFYILRKKHPHSKIDKAVLSQAFAQMHEDVDTFSQNFDQMKNFSDKNHAKIFDVAANGQITIWPPINEFVERYMDKIGERIDYRKA